MVLAIAWPLTAAAQTGSPRAILSSVSPDAPECFGLEAERTDCLVRTADGQTQWIGEERGRWRPAKALGGKLAQAPDCVMRGPNGFNCLGVQTDGTLAHIAYNAGAWSRWQNLGGDLGRGRVSCLTPQRDWIICFARDAAGRLAEKAWLGDATWQPWRIHGGSLASDPSCVALPLDQVACLARAPSGKPVLWHSNRKRPGGQFAPIASQTIVGTPSCQSLERERFVCLARGQGGALIEISAPLSRVSADAVRVQVLAMDTAGDPDCARRPGGRIDCVYRTADRSLALLTASREGWSEPVRLGFTEVAAGRCVMHGLSGGLCFASLASRKLEVIRMGLVAAPIARLDSPPQSLPITPVSASVFVPAPLAHAWPPFVPTHIALAEPAAPQEHAPPAQERPVWTVTESATGQRCTVRLDPETGATAQSVMLGPECRRLASMASVARWRQDGRIIRFLDQGGRVYFQFFPSGDQVYRAKWRRGGEIILSQRDQPIVNIERTPPPPSLAGQWRLRGARAGRCELDLRLRGRARAVRVKGRGCDARIARAQAWVLDNGELRFIAPNGGVLARFRTSDGQTWRGGASPDAQDWVLARS